MPRRKDPTESWRDDLEGAVGSGVVRSEPVSGGCIHEARRVALADGRVLFLKSNPRSAPGLFATEAAGLRWLAGFDAIAVPEVVAWRDPGASQPGYLALGWVDEGRIDGARFGTALARLHSVALGLEDAPNRAFIGPLPQDNRPAGCWASFWRDRRIVPMAERAADHLPRSLRSDIERLCELLPDLLRDVGALGPLHGDLWSGNAMADAAGRPVLFDPAAYVGDPEVDLAMMALFGGFDRQVWRAYRCERPAPPDEVRRRAIYQVWPLLVHVVLFGSGYLGQLAAAVEAGARRG